MKNNLSSILGERLLKVSNISDGTGISRTTLTELYYRKNKDIKLSTLLRICDYLDVPLSELIEYIPNKK